MSFIQNGEVYILVKTWNHLEEKTEEYQGEKSKRKKIIKNFRQIGGNL